MSDTTPRFSLPHLFPGQAQKEFTFNEAMARIDMVLHPDVVGERSQDPVDPVAGDAFLVGDNATGAFSSHAGMLAAWDGEQWTFIAPREGMAAFDRERGALLHFRRGAWRHVNAPVPAEGGTVIDPESRRAINEIIAGLKESGIFS